MEDGISRGGEGGDRIRASTIAAEILETPLSSPLLQILSVQCPLTLYQPLLLPQQYTHTCHNRPAPSPFLTSHATSHSHKPPTKTVTHTRKKLLPPHPISVSASTIHQALAERQLSKQVRRHTYMHIYIHTHARTHMRHVAQGRSLETHLEAGCPALLPPWSLSLSAAV